MSAAHAIHSRKTSPAGSCSRLNERMVEGWLGDRQSGTGNRGVVGQKRISDSADRPHWRRCATAYGNKNDHTRACAHTGIGISQTKFGCKSPKNPQKPIFGFFLTFSLGKSPVYPKCFFGTCAHKSFSTRRKNFPRRLAKLAGKKKSLPRVRVPSGLNSIHKACAEPERPEQQTLHCAMCVDSPPMG